MVNLSIKLDASKLISNYKKLEKEYPVAIVSAINKTATQAMNYSQKEIQNIYTIKPSILNKKENLTVIKAHTGAFTGHGQYEAIIRGKGIGIPLIHFQNEKFRGGIAVKVKKSSGLTTIPSSFRTKMQSGHKGIFKRVKQSTIGGMYVPKSKGKWGFGEKKWIRGGAGSFLGGDKLVPRLPIDEKYGPGTAVMLRNQKVQMKIKIYVTENFARIFKHEIEWFISKK